MRNPVIKAGIVAGIGALALSACNGNQMTSLPVAELGLTTARIPVGTKFRLEHGKGLEIIDLAGEDLYAEEDAFLTKTDAGWALTLPDGKELEFPRDKMESLTDGVTTYLSLELPVDDYGDHLRLTMHGAGAGLKYSEYGTWAMIHSEGPVVNAAAWTTGLPTETLPVNGTAQYEGAATGLVHYDTEIYDLAGKAKITADFAKAAISGLFSDLKVSSDGATLSKLNDLALSGAIRENGFVGEVVPQGKLGSADPRFNLEGAMGAFGGRFHGPNAEEAAGTFRIQTSHGLDMLGSFGLHRDRP